MCELQDIFVIIMVKHCCFSGCNSNTKRPQPGVVFKTFVKSPIERVRRWIHLCGRDAKDFDYAKATSRVS